MVALEVVLEAVLPVRLQLPGDTLAPAERLEADPARFNGLRNPLEVLAERARVRVGVREDERPPGLHGDREEGVELGVEAGLALGARCAEERSVEVVRPGVVRALQGRAAALTVGHQMRAVPTDVLEAAQHAVLAPHSDDRDMADTAGEKRPRLDDGLGASEVLPGACEDPVALV